MTERFIIMDNLPKGTHSSIWDNQKQHNQGIGDELWLGEVVAMLNEGVILAEENEELKTFLESLREELSLADRDNTALEKENERLKQQNKMLRTNVGKLTDDVTYLRNLPSTHQKENKQLKAQLLYDGDGVCNICKHQYLVKTEKYYVAKCEKEHEECSKVDLQYCEDFELVRDYE